MTHHHNNNGNNNNNHNQNNHKNQRLPSQPVIANTRTITDLVLFMPLVQCIEEDNYEHFASLYASTKEQWWAGMTALHHIKGYDKGLDFQFHEKIIKSHDIALLKSNSNTTNNNHNQSRLVKPEDYPQLSTADFNAFLNATQYKATLPKSDFSQRCALYFITYGTMTGKKFLQVAILLENMEMATFLWNLGFSITEKQFLKMSLFGFLKPEYKEFFRLQERYLLQQRLERNLIRKNAKKKKQPEDKIYKI